MPDNILGECYLLFYPRHNLPGLGDVIGGCVSSDLGDVIGEVVCPAIVISLPKEERCWRINKFELMLLKLYSYY